MARAQATSWRYLWLALLSAGCFGVVYMPMRQRAHETRVKTLMHQLQRALLAYHEREEIYVPAKALSGGELADVLRASGDLKTELVNPFAEGLYDARLTEDPVTYRAEGAEMKRYYLGVVLDEEESFLVFESPPEAEAESVADGEWVNPDI